MMKIVRNQDDKPHPDDSIEIQILCIQMLSNNYILIIIVSYSLMYRF